MTGIYTGRSPKDKFIVMDENPKIQFGGHLMNTRTTTTRLQKKLGMLVKKSQKRTFQQETFRSRCILRC